MSINISKLFDNLESVSKEKDISIDKVIEILKHALEKAYLKENPDINVLSEIDIKKKIIGLKEIRVIVDKTEDEIDDDKEINLSDALKEKKDAKLGDEFISSINIDDFERRIAVHALQIFQQKLNEESNLKIYDIWKDKINSLVKAEVEKNENKYVEVNLGSTMGIVLKSEQIPNEDLKPGERYFFLIKEIKEQSKGWPIILSRSSPKLVESLLAINIPEVGSGIVSIESIARVPGFKTKIAVSSNDPNVDAVGTCVGQGGERIKNIAANLNDEKIDIFLYDKNPKQFIVNMCNPERIVGLEITDDEESKETNPNAKIVTIICKDEDLLKIIGRNGVNVKLMSMLTKWSIDVVPLSIAIEDKIEYEDVTDLIPIKYMSSQRRTNNYSNTYSSNNNFSPKNKFNNWKSKFNNANGDDEEFKYERSNFNNDWDYTDVTDEDVENLLSSSNKSEKKKRKPSMDDEEEIIFVSDSQKKNVSFDDNQNNEYSENNFSNIEIGNKYSNKSTVSIDEFFDSMENNSTKKKTKKDSKFSKPSKQKNSESKKDKKKIDVLDEYDDISVDDYDDSLDIEIDDIDYDEFE